MTRRVPALGFALCVAACAPSPQSGSLQGYGEARVLTVAAEDGGRISRLDVREGDRVSAGQVLFALDPARAGFAADSATAVARAAQDRTARDGALAQAERRARAEADAAQLTLARTQKLMATGFASKARNDADLAAARAAEAAVAQAHAERIAAGMETESAAAGARLATRKVKDAVVAAPADGIVQTIYRRPGEVVAPGAPLAAMIARDGMRVRFFAPQARLTELAPGARVQFTCDGCKSGLGGRVSYVASEPQFTPPVIYSREQRQKLVFLVEATPDDPEAIRPGLPVDVRVAP